MLTKIYLINIKPEVIHIYIDRNGTDKTSAV